MTKVETQAISCHILRRGEELTPGRAVLEVSDQQAVALFPIKVREISGGEPIFDRAGCQPAVFCRRFPLFVLRGVLPEYVEALEMYRRDGYSVLDLIT